MDFTFLPAHPIVIACVLVVTALMARGAGAEDSTAEERPLLLETFDDSKNAASTSLLLDHSSIHLEPGAGPDGSAAIRVDYVGCDRGSERVVTRIPLAKAVDEATLSFNVRFGQDFKWVLGGKLHGLGPMQWVTGGNDRVPEGWSARMMFKQEGRLATYLYDQDVTKKWGVGKTTDAPVLNAGQWHRIVLEVKLNTPGVADGSARVLVDGREVVFSPNVMYRGVGGDDTRIQTFLFSTFHGGNTPKFSPVDDLGNHTVEHAWFDNFMVTEGIQ